MVNLGEKKGLNSKQNTAGDINLPQCGVPPQAAPLDVSWFLAPMSYLDIDPNPSIS